MREVLIHHTLWERACDGLFPPTGEEGFAFCVARLSKKKRGTRIVVDDLVPLAEQDIQYQRTAGSP
nr:hypothetical protein [Desulfobacula sp.]